MHIIPQSISFAHSIITITRALPGIKQPDFDTSNRVSNQDAMKQKLLKAHHIIAFSSPGNPYTQNNRTDMATHKALSLLNQEQPRPRHGHAQQ